MKQKESYVRRVKPKEHTCELCGMHMKIQTYSLHFKNKHDISSEEYFNTHPQHLTETFIPKNYITVMGVVVLKGTIKSVHTKVPFRNITHLKRWLLVRAMSFQSVVASSFLEDSFYDGYTNREWLDKLGVVLSYKLNRHSYDYAVLRWDKETADEKGLIKSESMKGDANPAYQHGGRLSPFSDKFFKYMNNEVNYTVEDVRRKKMKSVVDNPQNQRTRIEYYLDQGMSQEEAVNALSNHQRTFSFDKCIEKYGYIEGYNIWKERQDKWQNTLNSKSQQEIDQINMVKGTERVNQLFQYNPEIKNIPATKRGTD